MFHVGLLSLLVLCSFCYFSTKASDAEYRLKTDLFKKYNPSVIPVKNTSTAVDVEFDIALRSISELNEKTQTLTSSTWIRIHWKDEFLTWDPKNYSGVSSINLMREQVWVPDLVLYNSADAEGKGMLYESIQTQVTINYTGNARWYSPMILMSDCAIKLNDFPFDSQTCPLRIGLWTFDELRVRLSLTRSSGDTGSYTKNGVFLMNGMPATKQTIFYTCCPGIPYVRLNYEIQLQRKTVFYLFNFFFPGILLVVMSFVSYMLPPECGERISLGITNLLALNFFLLMVSSSIPPISLSIPMITEFLTAVIMVSVVTLITTAMAIKFSFFTNEESDSKAPWAIRVLVNKHIAYLMCMKYGTEEQGSFKRERDYLEHEQQTEIPRGDTEAEGVRQRHSVAAAHNASAAEIAVIRGNRGASDVAVDGWCNSAIKEGMEKIVGRIRKDEVTSNYKAEWRFAITVLDRALGIVLAVITLIGGLYMFLQLPKILVK